MEDKHRISIDYRYDKNNRLVMCHVQGERANEYTYDPAGNLLFCEDASMQRLHKPAAAPSPCIPQASQSSVESAWQCDCGSIITGNFCTGCGQPKPVQTAPVTDGSWQCACGSVNKGAFCPKCGTKRYSSPYAPTNASWHCACGRTNKGGFCPQCGAKRPQ